MLIKHRFCRVGLCLAIIATPATAQHMGDVLEDGDAWLVAQQQSQTKVDNLSADTDAMRNEYRTVLREIEGLESYNRQLESQLDLQDAEIADLDDSISRVTQVDRQILPLMERMVASLEQLIALDLPFLQDERAERLRFVNEALERVDVTVAEKFRQVLEAYQVELEYGRTIEAYTGVTNVDGGKREVDFLRIGRIGLYYQTLDGEQTARWDPDSGSWVALAPRYRNAVRDAMQIARKLVAPDLLELPLPTPGGQS